MGTENGFVGPVVAVLQRRTSRSLRGRAPSARYSLRPGYAKGISVLLPRRDRRALRRDGRATGVLTSLEAGQHGEKTTIQTVTLRAWH
jgi:hypothetical protein